MAGSLNSVHLIGRLTRDPEIRVFGNGGKVAEFGLAVDERRKNQSTGEWESHPTFLNLKAFNSGDYRKTADLIEQYCRKGMLVFIDGKLTVESWEDKNGGGKRTAVKIIVNNVQFLEKKQDSPPSQPPSQGQQSGSSYDYPPPPDSGGDIPF